MHNLRVSRLLFTAVACAAFCACEAAQVTGTPSGQPTPTGVASDGTRPAGSAPSSDGGQQGGQATGSGGTGGTGGTGDAGMGTNAPNPTPGATTAPAPGNANASPTTGGGAANGNGAATGPGNANSDNANNGNATTPAATGFSWGSLRYAFFGYQRQGVNDDVDGLELFLTANPNFCAAVPASAFAGLPSENSGAMGMGTLTAGEGSAYLYLSGAAPGATDNGWSGVKDYGVVQLTQQTHALTRASQVALSPNTCLLRTTDAPSYPAQFVVQALTDDTLTFTLSDPNATSVTAGGVKATAGTNRPSFPYQLTASRCDFYLPLVQATALAQGSTSSNVGSANAGGGLPYVPCRATKAATGTGK